MMKMSSKFLIFSLFAILFLNTLIGCSQTYDEKEYELEITVRIQSAVPFIAIQTFPLTVYFELKNTGNRTFNGALTIQPRVGEISYAPRAFQVTNLTKNEVYKNSLSLVTDYEGRYYFSFEIESDDLSHIKLYSNSIVLAEGIRVRTNAYSIYVYSLYIVIIAIGVIVSILGIVVAYFKKKE